MIVDVHTHVFPPRMIAAREELAAADVGFAAIYGSPRARMATAEQLLASMQRAGVDQAVACGFWWDDAALAAEHAEYLLQAAAEAGGRLLPFVPVGPLGGRIDYVELGALAARGACGVGEVRVPRDGHTELRALARAAGASGLPLLLHVSEEVGHAYPGKTSGLTPGGLWSLLEACPEATMIAAHWGGGLPFYALMPEVRAALARGRLLFDTAASPLLYEPRVFATVIELVGADLVLWGSDYPLRDQAADRAAAAAAIADEGARAVVLGGNAARLFGLE